MGGMFFGWDLFLCNVDVFYCYVFGVCVELVVIGCWEVVDVEC